MRNPVIANGAWNAAYLANPVKNMLAVHSPFYTGYLYIALTDYYDSGIGTWLAKDLQVGPTWSNNGISTTIQNSPYFNYIVGITGEDGDESAGFLSSDFTSNPPGFNGIHLGMQVATLSPLEAGNSNIGGFGIGYVYANTQIYSKLALRNALATEYGTVAAPNTSWGSSYTTFDSSGICVGSQPITCASTASTDRVGTGDGTTLTFNTTLSHTTVSGLSLQILVAETPVASDDSANGASITGNFFSGSHTTGLLWGPKASGTINYSTGAVSITFTSGHAPANLAAITATYVANGWGIGTGFLDEDERVL